MSTAKKASLDKRRSGQRGHIEHHACSSHSLECPGDRRIRELHNDAHVWSQISDSQCGLQSVDLVNFDADDRASVVQSCFDQPLTPMGAPSDVLNTPMVQQAAELFIGVVVYERRSPAYYRREIRSTVRRPTPCRPHTIT